MGAVSPQDNFVSQSSSRSNGGEDSRVAVIANLKEQLATERRARRNAEESLRETHAGMTKHQQVGRMVFGFDRSLGTSALRGSPIAITTRLWADTREGDGATFRFSLPVAREDLP